jgi:hypothetical protein
MTKRKLIIPALATIASATAVCLPVTANAAPVGPCADVPYVGVCVPPSEHPTPPPQQSLGGTAFVPDSSGGIHFVS